jgi:hypothetical protein
MATEDEQLCFVRDSARESVADTELTLSLSLADCDMDGEKVAVNEALPPAETATTTTERNRTLPIINNKPLTRSIPFQRHKEKNKVFGSTAERTKE